MPSPRYLTVNNDVAGIYHNTSRCVRQEHLFDLHKETGIDYSYRKDWIVDRARFLSEAYCIEVLTYSVMANHYHICLLNRPEKAAALTPEEVGRAWDRVHPLKDGAVVPNDPEATRRSHLEAFVRNQERVKTIRARLHNISWFMRDLNENIARRCNKEDGRKGHFWEDRFNCQRVTGLGALMTCMAYVDLNPVRAALAEDLEGCRHTGLKDHLLAHKANLQLEALPKRPNPTLEEKLIRLELERMSRRADWLVPFGQKGSVLERISFESYVRIVEEAGKQIKENKPGRLPVDLVPTLEALELDVDRWVQNVRGFRGLFFRAAGTEAALKELARESGKKWCCGKAGAQSLYAKKN